jgi:hypothetical protein
MSHAWFLIVYSLFGIIFLWFGGWMIFTPHHLTNYIVKTAAAEKQPRLILKWLKYFFIFSMISLIVSFYPLDLHALVFSFSSLILVFIFGRMLLSWDAIRSELPKKGESILKLTRRTGFLIITLSVISFAFWYLHVTR